MRAVVQRVQRARVVVSDEVVGEIGHGLCVLVGVGHSDQARDALALAQKVVQLRVFQDAAGKMNRAVRDVGGKLLAVSQFTLFGDARRGNRPSFASAMEPTHANALFETFCSRARDLGVLVQTGRFGADMQVDLLNDGPVTILLDTEKVF